MTAIALVVSDLILIRILHLVIPSQYWYFSDHSLQALVLYLGGLLLFFSLLRRYRAGTLWTSSLICRIQKKMLILKTRQNFRSRLGIGFVLYLAINTALISLAWYFWDRVYANLYVVYLLTGLTVLVFLLFNLWIFTYCSGRQANRNPSAMPSASSPPGRPAISLISMNLTVRSSRWQRTQQHQFRS